MIKFNRRRPSERDSFVLCLSSIYTYMLLIFSTWVQTHMYGGETYHGDCIAMCSDIFCYFFIK